ncbi:hypothetical protein KKA14_16120 [bacterium]|nr:hypothetical protein [bacterium]
MGKFDSVFKKTNSSGIDGSAKKAQRTIQKKPGGHAPQENDKHSKFVLTEMEGLLQMFPGSPEFLGRAEYTIKKSLLSIVRRKYPSLTEMRESVIKFADQKELSDPRVKIKKLLKKYPAYPDLRALNAIQIFSDASQSGLDSKKTKVLQGALREMTRAMYNGGLGLFNINWFIKIYIRYLESLKDKYQIEYKSSRNHFSREVRLKADELHRKHLQLAVMSSVKSKLSGLTMLNAKLKGSVYVFGSISEEEIGKACLAIQAEDGSRKIGDGGKSANNILYIIMTLNLLFARIPILDNLVKKYQRSIPDISRDIILQKVMVNNTRSVTEFQMAMASGDKTLTHDIARKMYLNCLDIIKQHLEFGVLTKQQEIDPFIKAIWIAKESRGLYDDDKYKKKLESALKLLEIIMGKRVQVKGTYELARQLQDDIHFIMIENEWMK